MKVFDRLVHALGLKKKEVNVLVVGLNNSGKSTVINHFKREDERCIDIVPTVGFNVEKFACMEQLKKSNSLFTDYLKNNGIRCS
ncbi:ADP-ribosylation factor-like protein 6 [Cotesia glomerata]|uniref:ADP-ribosylation factor-like protein 6 n=1 Tax=Cotesia glomerata TaxID=32391 RepID=A0AAV7IMG7_COTGL|nr:ADP-ribosylation factor-like protein 6 [Cotesia glomerata]